MWHHGRLDWTGRFSFQQLTTADGGQVRQHISQHSECETCLGQRQLQVVHCGWGCLMLQIWLTAPRLCADPDDGRAHRLCRPDRRDALRSAPRKGLRRRPGTQAFATRATAVVSASPLLALGVACLQMEKNIHLVAQMYATLARLSVASQMRLLEPVQQTPSSETGRDAATWWLSLWG